MTVIDPTF